ncbi:efflux RND transporter periplasmic adaptor subunit [Phytopseudomonas dryadis]|uniref:Efflux RND transporter periplasmic adaptor subunit n=1 Tax=Phytopseudomonas dryadis TaxID=2487520 RepID=A0A4Q9QTU5_9GAMM|nr:MULTISPECIES: efflux RND transporter periplasmic adaptor subunit [Pseudomonas]TBU86554.1 efflux RND transporter periplasmic adaptor subunit [Pseudomonas dryadis]TBV07248.1 efflux RND transporter periplasmic adaptor subunit [Pseudomonas dryadis]TBV13427.1 efflux RND transporter periplasmic adaptor subunit [Pseudomonas sp. FRB 230]
MFRHALSFPLPACLALFLVACGNGEAPQPSIRPAMVVQPQLAAELVDTYPGEVRARLEPELAFRIAGKVSKRLVDVGQRVDKDAPLAELDPQDVRLQLDAARAQVLAAEANLQLARAERDRYRTLLGRQMVSQSQYDNAENTFRAGEARLRQLRAEFNVADNQAGYAVLRAPQSGVIVQRNVEVGQVVAAGQQVFALAADGEREVLIDLPEQAIKRFRIGQAVAVELWSQPGQRFAGRIRELSPAADPRSRTYAARIAFSEGEVPAELGQSARVFIAHDGDVPLAVPLSALTAEKDQPYVWVVDPQDSTLRRTPVRIGPYAEKQVPVLDGLKASDWVVVAGVQVLLEGQQVRPVDRQNRAVDLAAKE